jgi:oxaloacetate decarboxylase alpha subunit
MLPGLQERHPEEDLDTLLLRAQFAGTQVDEMKKAVAAGGNPDEIPRPVLGLIKGLYAKNQAGRQSLKSGELQVTIDRGDEEDAA